MLPTFIIIGAMKSGTTSLYHYLSIHPEISMSTTKELDFFVAEKNYGKGINWYESKFTGTAKAYGEASTSYSKYPTFAGVPQRMYSVVPDVKLIYILRDPIERIVSHYVHNYSGGEEKRDIFTVLSELNNNHYIACSKYYMQLEQYLEYYSRENVLIITAEELRSQRRQSLKTLFNFLGVDDSFYSPEYSKVFHKSSVKKKLNIAGRYLSRMNIVHRVKSSLPSPLTQIARNTTGSSFDRVELDQALKEKLIEYLKDDVDSLRQFTGDNFEGWNL